MLIRSGLRKFNQLSQIKHPLCFQLYGTLPRHLSTLRISGLRPPLLSCPLHLPCQKLSSSYQFQIRKLSFSEFFYICGETIANSLLVQKTTSLLICFHDATGSPWYLSILMFTTIFRTLLIFPFMLYNRHLDCKLAQLEPLFRNQLDRTRLEIGERISRGELDPSKGKHELFWRMRRFRTQFFMEHNAHPGKKIVMHLFQFPIWMAMSFSMANLTWRPTTFVDPAIREDLSREGTLWFTNLVQPDPFGLLSVIFGASSVFALLYPVWTLKASNVPMSRGRKILTGSFLLWMLCLSVSSIQFPSGIVLYWTVSMINGNVQNVLLSRMKMKSVPKIH